MITNSNDILTSRLDTKLLATLILEFNIARRNVTAYPKGHPVIASSLAKVLRVYEELLSTEGELVLGVTSDTLMVDGVALEKKNPVYRDFSHVLFERGIGALLFHRDLTIEELDNFTSILSLKREQILQQGGIEQVWDNAAIASISIKTIRYDLFETTDADFISVDSTQDPGEGLWQRFTRKLTLGHLPDGINDPTSLDPEILAELLNREFISGNINETEVKSAIGDFLARTERDPSFSTISKQPYQKLASFISTLTPELRRQFLDSSFGSKNQDRRKAAEDILSNLSENAIIETLEDINTHRLNVSPVVFGLLQRLGQNAKSHHNSSDESMGGDELSEKMKTIFREHSSEEFVPDDYQQRLNHIIASDQISRLNMEEVAGLLASLENSSIEQSIGQILINLIREGVETPEERELLLQNLNEMFGFYLQTGDYGQLHKMIDQLTDGTFPVEIQYRLRDEYGQDEYLQEILDGLIIWGKPRYDDIRAVILKMGGQFIEALLDRLSEEKNMSLRRFYISCLIEMGPVTRVPIINRLYDTRWYFLRNLLIILSARNDQTIIPLIRPLLRSEDPRLRHEALKTLTKLGDPQAEKQIIDDLNSENQEQQISAIQLTEQCNSAAIANKLTSMLSQGGYSQSECDKKSAIVHALGEIGRAEVLPELAKILGSRSLLHSRQLTKLKYDIIHSFPKYSPNVSRPVLKHLAEGSGEIAALAEDTLKLISGKSS